MRDNVDKQVLEDAQNALGAMANDAFEVDVDLQARRIRLRTDVNVVELDTLIEPHLTRTKLNFINAELKDYHHKKKVVLVARYINAAIAETLKGELDIQFIDTAGNAYINRPPLFVYVTGNKLPERGVKQRPQTRLFQTAGIKVLFALFCVPELVNAPYREIAKCAGVAPTGITLIFRDMKQRGYLLEKGPRDRRLVKKKELLQRWVEAFNERLRPKLVRKRVCTRDTASRDWWKNVDLRTVDACWGGEVAGAKLTHYLVPANATIYKAGALGKLQVMYGFEENPDGNIEIVEPFWGELDAACKDDMVHPILVYAELLATHDARAIETAEMIYEQELTRLVGED